MHETLRRFPDPGITIVRSDGLTALPTRSFDLIVSNPPHMDVPSPTVYHSAGNDPGWRLHRHLFADAPRVLTPQGRLVLIENGSPGYSTPETFAPMIAASPMEVEAIHALPATEYAWYVMVLRARGPHGIGELP